MSADTGGWGTCPLSSLGWFRGGRRWWLWRRLHPFLHGGSVGVQELLYIIRSLGYTLIFLRWMNPRLLNVVVVAPPRVVVASIFGVILRLW